MRLHKFLTLIATLGILLPATASAVVRGTLTSDTVVHRSPDGGSEVLGRLRSGTGVNLVSATKTGWYSISFSKPVKGATKGWIQKDSVRIEKGAGASSASRPAARGRHGKSDFYIGPQLGYTLGVNATAFNTAIGGTTGAGGGGLTYGASAMLKLSNSIWLDADAFYYSFTAPGGAPATAIYYFSNGFVANLSAAFKVVNGNGKGLDIFIAPGAGLSMNSAGNGSGVNIITTSNVIGILFGGKIVGTLPLTDDGSTLLKIDLGYRMMTLSGIPYLGAGQSGSATGQESMNLSAMYATLGIVFGL
ncbi:SH3 domain-containing protein [bacterium]|nr:SH3 domain-containing protein [bacterium]